MGLLSILQKCTDAGSSFLTSDRARRVNRLQNQFNLLYLSFFLVQLLASALLGAYLFFFERGNFYPALLLYALPPVASAVFLLQLFRHKLTRPGSPARELIYHGYIVAVVSVMCLLLGNASAFWLFYLPHFVNTFMIFNISRRQAWMFSALTGAFMIPTLLFSARSGSLLPLPRHITYLVSIIIITLFSGLAFALAAATWWRLGLTRRFIRLWVAISNAGTHLFVSEFEKKYRRIQNQIILIFIGLMAFLIATMGVILLDIWLETSEPLLPYILHYGIFIFSEFILLILCLRINSRSAQITGTMIAWFSGLIHIVFLGISLQLSTKFYLFSLVLLPMPYIALSSTQLINRIVAHACSLLLFAAMLGSLWFLKTHQPLRPLPDIITFKIIQYAIPAILVLTYIMYLQYVWKINAETEETLEAEKEKSDRLLLNILPPQVAQELKARGKADAILFRSATVMFTDFVGFTSIAESMSPEELVSELDRCFSYFDAVCARYRLEKLKTIGDAYMAAGGIPVPNNTHAIDCCLAALEIQAFMNQMKEIKAMQSLPYWELRLGINTGNLVAGVVGEKKFAYDVWGDSVNMASRMESAGMAGAINISRATYELVRFLFRCTYRGRIQAKNKGEVDMYLLEGIRPRFSIDGNGKVPNAEFQRIYERIQAGARLIAAKTLVAS
ncbi:MAG TPA: adenylate/guanylate cyclase domain-containing protein [Turneriella sp.]|nr:adenylate/guanylate cyclase domain-containing protein [Turneriella sp.]HNL09181.1 adenylate/guanylate cyclase domain-containing protein [Turneriella sp.]